MTAPGDNLEERRRKLRWQLFLERETVEGAAAIAQRAEADGNGERVQAERGAVARARREITRLEAELAELERPDGEGDGMTERETRIAELRTAITRERFWAEEASAIAKRAEKDGNSARVQAELDAVARSRREIARLEEQLAAIEGAGLSEREARIRELRWQLFNARSAVADHLDIAKRAEGRDDGGRSSGAHHLADLHRADIARLEAELAELERSPDEGER